MYRSNRQTTATGGRAAATTTRWSCLCTTAGGTTGATATGTPQRTISRAHGRGEDTCSTAATLPLARHGADGTPVCVVVCGVSAQQDTAATTSWTATTTAHPGANHFLQAVVRLHGVPSSIVSDQDTRFTGNFWQQLWTALGTKLQMSTSNHPQTDGQSERTNQTVETLLRPYINYNMSNWVEQLPLVEFAINNSVQTSTGSHCLPSTMASTHRHQQCS